MRALLPDEVNSVAGGDGIGIVCIDVCVELVSGALQCKRVCYQDPTVPTIPT